MAVAIMQAIEGRRWPLDAEESVVLAGLSPMPVGNTPPIPAGPPFIIAGGLPVPELLTKINQTIN